MPPAAYDAASSQDVNKTVWGYHAKMIGLDGPLMVLWAIVAALASGGLIITLYMLIWAHDKMSHYNIYNPKQRYSRRVFEDLRKKGDDRKSSEKHNMYEKYYAVHCEYLVKKAQQSFHVSTYLTMILATITLSARLAVNYHSQVGATVFIAIISVMLAVVLVMHMTLRLNPQLDKKIVHQKDKWKMMEQEDLDEAGDDEEAVQISVPRSDSDIQREIKEDMQNQLEGHSEFLLQQFRPLTDEWVNSWVEKKEKENTQEEEEVDLYASMMENGDVTGHENPLLPEANALGRSSDVHSVMSDHFKLDAVYNEASKQKQKRSSRGSMTYSTADRRDSMDDASSLGYANGNGVGNGNGDFKYFPQEKRLMRPEKRGAKQTSEL